MECEQRMLLPSLYNMIIPKKDGIAAYNTKTGRTIRSFGQQADTIVKLLNGRSLVSAGEGNHAVDVLYKQGFLVDSQLDELKEMEQLEERSTFDNYLRLTILPTELCNFRCVYCYEHFKRGKMSIDVQKSIIQSVENQIDRYDGLIVSWFGGEPLEALEVVQTLSLAFIRICKNHKKVYSAGMTTNGYNLTVETVRSLKGLHVTDYQITLDGLPTIHDAQRVLHDGTGTADKIIRNLLNIKTQIKSSLITIILRTNFSKELTKSTDEFIQLLDENFSNDPRFRFYWQVVSDYGYVQDNSVRDIFGTKDDYLDLMRRFTRHFKDKYVSQLYGPAGSVCYALKRNAFVIAADGVIKKCTCDMEMGKNHFGLVGESFDHDKHEAWLRREISPNSKCYSCIKRPICHNKACYKAKRCLPNLDFLPSICDLLSEKEENYTVI